MAAFQTASEIAAKAGVPVWRVIYVLRDGKIPEAGRAGNCRLFDAAAVTQIHAELRRIEERHAAALPTPALA
jgi:hypothetical protein